ncbi:hypothetical protein RZN25_05625 [Bacillaceae bacterium S4-13-56]
MYTPQIRENSTLSTSSLVRNLESASTQRLNTQYYKQVKEYQKKRFNLQKLYSFKELELNWNNNQGLPFDREIILFCIDIVSSLTKQPDVFPTGRNSIQLEYEKENGEYLEFEVFQNQINVFYMNGNDDEKEDILSITEKNQINEIVSEFYEGNN